MTRHWGWFDDETADVERVFVIHDEQLAAIPRHRCLTAWDRLQRFVSGTRRATNSGRWSSSAWSGAEGTGCRSDMNLLRLM
ncbi:hypothetical protein EGY31_30770 [Burkholderia multivorans]|nr:hypothetical protein EGY31_30770 [Burkholderia multivorans]